MFGQSLAKAGIFNMKHSYEKYFRVIFYAIAVSLLLLLPYLSKDSGITDDENLHLEHGQRLLDYYEGQSTYAMQSPFDSTGKWLWLTEGVSSKTSINIYGGFFDLIAAFGYKYVAANGADVFEFKHSLSALFGAIFLICTGLIAYRVSGLWSVAVLALLLGAVSPRIIGHSIVNPKDIPFAAFYAFALLQIVRVVKQPEQARWYQWLLVALGIAMAIAVRVGAITLIGYLYLFVSAQLLLLYLKHELSLKEAAVLFAKSLVTGIAGYLLCGLFWPWAAQDPIFNPLKALEVFRHFNMFNSYELFEGRWINNFEIPWYFVPKWFYVTFPVSVVVGFVLFFVLAPQSIQRHKNLLPVGLLLISVLLPVITIITSKSNIYDDCRHLYFTLPSVLVLAALAWYELLSLLKNRMVQLLAYLGLALLIWEPIGFMLRNHPLQVMYFSPAIGGVKGAFKNYEMDYWGFSCRKAVEWIGANAPDANPAHRARVRIWYGEQEKVKHFTDSSANMVHVFANENSTNYDYSVQLAAEAKFNHDLLYHWPPKGTVYEVMVDSVPLCAVIKNYHTDAPSPSLVFNNQNPVTNDPTATGLNFYNLRKFNEAIVAFKKAIQQTPGNVVNYNNIVASYNNLTMYDDAIEWAKRGLQIDPAFTLLKNNLQVALEAKKKAQYNEQYYAGASYNYYCQREFEKCVTAARQVLKLNPKSAAAYNNICSACNELGRFAEAQKACEAGLQLVPNDKLLENNLNAALTGLKNKQ